MWLLTVIPIIITPWISMDERSWRSDLLIVGVLQYGAVGLIHMGAIVADRDIQWAGPLNRLRWISFGLAATLLLIVVPGLAFR